MDTQLSKPTNQNSIKVPKVFSQRIRECYYKTLETSKINVPSHPEFDSLLYFFDVFCPFENAFSI